MSDVHDEKNFAGSNEAAVSGSAGKLFVGQVPAVCTEDMLRPVFQPYGEIVEIKIMRDAPGGRSKGCAWVKYATREQAQAAIDSLHEQHTIPPQTNTLQVRFADDKSRTAGSTTAFVGNLPTNTAAETLRDYIQSILPPGVSIKDVNVPAGKLFGFVTFETAQDCSSAVAHIQGANPTLNGNSLRVQAARPRTATSNIHSQSAQQASAGMYGGGFGQGGQPNGGRGGGGGYQPVMDPFFFGRGGGGFPGYNPYAPYNPYAGGYGAMFPPPGPMGGPQGNVGGGGGRGRGRGGNSGYGGNSGMIPGGYAPISGGR